MKPVFVFFALVTISPAAFADLDPYRCDESRTCSFACPQYCDRAYVGPVQSPHAAAPRAGCDGLYGVCPADPSPVEVYYGPTRYGVGYETDQYVERPGLLPELRRCYGKSLNELTCETLPVGATGG